MQKYSKHDPNSIQYTIIEYLDVMSQLVSATTCKSTQMYLHQKVRSNTYKLHNAYLNIHHCTIHLNNPQCMTRNTQKLRRKGEKKDG